MIRLSWEDVTTIARRQSELLASRIRPIDDVLILGRGGLAVASLVSRFQPTLLDQAVFFPIRNATVNTTLPFRACSGSVTVVYLLDDIYDGGRTFAAVERAVRVCLTPVQVWYAPLVSKKLIPSLLTGGIIETTEWVHFPWEVESDVASLRG